MTGYDDDNQDGAGARLTTDRDASSDPVGDEEYSEDDYAQPVLDEYGDQVVDEYGRPIYEYAEYVVDEYGEAVLDEYGSPVYEYVQTAFDDDAYDYPEPEAAPDGAAHRQRRPPARRRRRSSESRHRRIMVVLAVALVLLLVVGLVGVVYARRQINPSGPLGAKVAVSIPQDASTSEIANILVAAGVIHEARLFPLYIKLTNTSGLLPGNYQLAQNESYGRAVNALQAGPVLITDKLTIPEGFTLAQIAVRIAALPGLHLSAAKFLAAGTSGEVRSTFEPKGVNNLEGLVFPATYEVQQGQEEADILQELVNTFDLRATALGLTAGAAKLHLTPYQVVTVASIVEREAKLEADRGDVASTIYNRLTAHMTLGADSTQTYYLRLTNPTVVPTVAQLNTPSPYNTRTEQGLPPTPIANPGIPSLQAAIDPPTTSDLYFVEINPDGKLGFATDVTGFDALQAQCQAAKLC